MFPDFLQILNYSGPPLWSSGHNSWLQIQRPGFDSRRYQIFWEAMRMERGPLSLVSTIEKLLERKSSGSGLESENTAVGDSSRWPRRTLYPQKLALTSPTSVGRLVGIVRSRTQATEFQKIGGIGFSNLRGGRVTHCNLGSVATHTYLKICIPVSGLHRILFGKDCTSYCPISMQYMSMRATTYCH
jgi:hypothetical protein